MNTKDTLDLLDELDEMRVSFPDMLVPLKNTYPRIADELRKSLRELEEYKLKYGDL